MNGQHDEERELTVEEMRRSYFRVRARRKAEARIAAGKCHRCAKPSPAGKACELCAKSQAERKRLLRAERLAAGQCQTEKCTKPSADGRRLCESCLSRDRQRKAAANGH